jgi:crotonobetainyl-CoA:carnitine CoA-transferase CaiB-like acyl-CoA transferase
LRLGYEDLQGVNPRIIHVGLFGYGEEGPYAGRPAYDDLIQGITAVPSLVAQASAGEPRYAPLVIADGICGLNAAHAVLAAVIHRDRSGEGQAIELPMFETMAQFVLLEHMGGRTFDPPLGPTGYSRLLAADRRPYRTRDGYLCVLVYSDKQWESFFRATGHETLASDPRFASQNARSRHYGEIYGLLADILTTRTTAEWTALLHAADIPCVPLNDLDGLIDDPHLAAAGLVQPMAHPSEGALNIVGTPGTWSRTPPVRPRPAPRLGADTREVLAEAGFTAEEIDAMISGGVAGAAPGEAADPE